MPRYILRPVNGAAPYVLIDIDNVGEKWAWRRLDENGRCTDAVDQMGHAPTLREAAQAAHKRFGAEISAVLLDNDTGLARLREYNAGRNA